MWVEPAAPRHLPAPFWPRFNHIESLTRQMPQAGGWPRDRRNRLELTESFQNDTLCRHDTRSAFLAPPGLSASALSSCLRPTRGLRSLGWPPATNPAAKPTAKL